MVVVAGLVSIAFGVVLVAHPAMGAALWLALVFGLFNLITGGWMLVRGIKLRHADAELDRVATAGPQPTLRGLSFRSSHCMATAGASQALAEVIL